MHGARRKRKTALWWMGEGGRRDRGVGRAGVQVSTFGLKGEEGAGDKDAYKEARILNRRLESGWKAAHSGEGLGLLRNVIYARGINALKEGRKEEGPFLLAA